MNLKLKRLFRPGMGGYFIVMLAFCAAAFVLRQYGLAGVELGVTMLTMIIYNVHRQHRSRKIHRYIRNAENTLESLGKGESPFPAVLIRLGDGGIVWTNSQFDAITQFSDTKVEKLLEDYLPGITYAWLAAAMAASDEIRRNARNYVTPTLLFQPQKDTMASASAQNEFVKNASNITLVTVDGAKHNLPFAGSGVLSPFFCKVLDFFNGFQENSPEQS